jgi:hypothetical protein
MVVRTHESLRIGLISLLMAVGYFLIYGNYGWSDTDQGFIQALSYRITLGEVPYRDFIYIRPPLSPYLHSLSMLLLPESLQTLAERFLFFLFCAIGVWLATLTLRTRFDFRQIGISPEFFAAIAFVFTVHNFPPMPWHTIDGLLLGSLGLYLIAASRHWGVAYVGLMVLLLAAMTKQAFYPMLIAGPILLAFLRGGRESLKATGAMVVSLLLIGGGIYVLDKPLLLQFWVQTTGATSLHDLFDAGLRPYAKPILFILLPLLVLRELNNNYETFAWFRHPVLTLFGLTLAGLLALHIIRAVTQEIYVPPSFGFGQTCLLLTVMIAIKGVWVHPRANVLLLTMVFLAWCGGLSWGYATPMLFFTPLLFGCLYIVHQELDFVAPRYFYGIVFLLVSWVFAMLYQYPYRDQPREMLNYDAGDVFPRLSHVYTGPYLYNKCKELRDFAEECEGTFAVLPAFPLAHYLTGTRPPLPVDWAHNAEMAYDRNAAQLVAQLDREVSLVLLEIDKLDQLSDTTRYGSGLAAYVQENWRRVKTGRYFEIYAPPDPKAEKDGIVYADTLQDAGLQPPAIRYQP